MGGLNPRPRIGVPYRTKNEQVTGDKVKIARYVDAIEMGGGEPVEIRLDLAVAELRSLMGTLDGVVLSGSPADVDPSLFQAGPHPKTAAPDGEREQTDFALLEHCFAVQKPVLAICYGIQSLNVFLGGTLIQDVPSEIGKQIEHEGSPESFHSVAIESGSRLAEIARSTVGVRVNSSHHQAVLAPGRDLRVVARASDGVIEAMEGTAGAHWLTAVQWHPERMVESDAFALSLFRALAAAARTAMVRS